MRHAGDDLFACRLVVVVPEQVVPGHPGPVCHQVTWGHQLRSEGILQAKPGQVGRERSVPLEQSVVDHRSQKCRGERLGRRSDREQRVRCHRKLALDVAVAESLGEDHLTAGDGRDRRSGYVPRTDRLLYELPESGQRRPRRFGGSLTLRELEREGRATPA